MTAVTGFDGPDGSICPHVVTRDPRLCAAVVERLTCGGKIIETGTGSYRLVHIRKHDEPD